MLARVDHSLSQVFEGILADFCINTVEFEECEVQLSCNSISHTIESKIMKSIVILLAVTVCYSTAAILAKRM